MKLTKADIDKVRHIEGFPIGTDEDIIALSRPPYYTACPNPFIEDFIREHGTPYDEATDDYHREPFAADVSEGKNDPIYMAHSYHTKVPYKAIMRYILHYTKPGDIVFDGFCGTGMTGVAAQMCGCPDPAFKAQVETEMKGDNIQWGVRNAILNDLSPVATYIAYSYNTDVDASEFEREAKHILSMCEKEYGWMYETQHVDADGKPICGLDGQAIVGRINYTIWSDVFVCPSCSREIVFYQAALNRDNGYVKEEISCAHCGAKFAKREASHVQISYIDSLTSKRATIAKQVPVRLNYTANGKRYDKKPDDADIDVLKRIDSMSMPSGAPNVTIPDCCSFSNTAQTV